MPEITKTYARRLYEARRYLWELRQQLPAILKAVFLMSCTVVMVTGIPRGSHARQSVAYAGRSKNYAYLMRMLFEEYEVVEERKRSVLTYGRDLERLSSTADVAVLDFGWPYDRMINRTGQYLEVPEWVNMVLPLSEDWSEVCGTFRRNARKGDLRLIRRNGYRWRVTNERSEVERFYDEMYLPFLAHYHPLEKVVDSRKRVVGVATDGKVLQVLLGERVVAAVVVHASDGVLSSLWMGMPRDVLESFPEGAGSALDYFAIQYAFEIGCTEVDLGGARSFLGDGVFQFKRKWGGRVVDRFSPNSILLKPRSSKGAVAACKSLPVLVRNREGGLKAVFVVDQDSGTDAFERLEKDFLCPGIDGVTVVQVGDQPASTIPASINGFPVATVSSTVETFPEVFTGRMIAGNNGKRQGLDEVDRPQQRRSLS